jgi:glycosyltransferase involved in cell wall biosynthesis
MPDQPPQRLGRILCVTSNLARWQGDSTTPFVLHLAEDLQALGWEIDLLAPHAPGAATQETLSGVNIERFRYLWPESQQSVCYQGGALINLRKNPLNKLKLPALVAAELIAVGRRLAGRDYDLLPSHWILPQGFTGMLATRLVRTPHVVTVHGGDLFGLRGRLMSQLKRATLQRANAVTANSSYTEQAIRDLTPQVPKLQRIPMGVSIDPLTDTGRQQTTQLTQTYRRRSGPLLLFIGRIVEEKGLEDLLHAIALLQGDLPDITALIVGEGQDREKMESLSISLKIADRVHFTGWVQPKDITSYLTAADIFVGPSRRAPDGWVEAQGLTFLEAMAAGTPVIATRLGGIVDSVQHEQTGLLIDERSPKQIAAAVHRLFTDPILTQAMTKKAHQQVLAHFSRKASAAAFSELFSDIISQTN